MNQLLFMIHNSLELYENLCQPVCRECGIAQTALDILMFLANNPEYYTARDICRVRGIKANLVSFHVEKLVQEGYLEREAIPGDRRQVRLLLTTKRACDCAGQSGAAKLPGDSDRSYRTI